MGGVFPLLFLSDHRTLNYRSCIHNLAMSWPPVRCHIMCALIGVAELGRLKRMELSIDVSELSVACRSPL